MEVPASCSVVPPSIALDAQEACLNLLPAKSKDVYNKEFADFNNWRASKRVEIINEDVLLSYFLNVRKKSASSSLWKKYSMLKSTLNVYKNIDISKYGKLIAFLKSESRAYKPKKAQVLEKEHIEQFLKEAPDCDYLMMKVFYIFLVI